MHVIFEHLTDQEILALLDPIMSHMMDGSSERNHAKHTRDFTDRLLCLVTPENLSRMCENYQQQWGQFEKREFVALFRRSDSIAVVWRQFCSLNRDQRVAEAVFVLREERILIDHAMVF